MSAEAFLQEALTAVQERHTHPHGPPASQEDQKVAGAACVGFCGGDRDRGRTLWRLITNDLGYMPKAACVALVRASETGNLVPDVEAPEL